MFGNRVVDIFEVFLQLMGFGTVEGAQEGRKRLDSMLGILDSLAPGLERVDVRIQLVECVVETWRIAVCEFVLLDCPIHEDAVGYPLPGDDSQGEIAQV